MTDHLVGRKHRGYEEKSADKVPNGPTLWSVNDSGMVARHGSKREKVCVLREEDESLIQCKRQMGLIAISQSINVGNAKYDDAPAPKPTYNGLGNMLVHVVTYDAQNTDVEASVMAYTEPPVSVSVQTASRAEASRHALRRLQHCGPHCPCGRNSRLGPRGLR